MGYTLSWNRRHFPTLNNGKPFFYKYDHRHDFKTVLIYKIRKSIDLSFTFVLNSGNRITLPTGFYAGLEGSYNYEFPDFMFGTNNTEIIYRTEGRNNVRMKTYHRADIGLDFHKTKKRGIRSWNITLYNMYSRQNPYLYYYAQKSSGDMKLRQISLFPIIPSFTYSFKWH